jgi:elongator complex protein 1
VVLHEGSLSFFSQQDRETPFRLTSTLGPIEELLSARILLLEWLVEEECVLCVGEDGSIFTVGREGEVDVKAQNEDGIAGASLSPTQDYLYLLTNNRTLIQLNKEFDLVSEIPLDEAEEVLATQPHFSWRADASHFVINYETVNGHKALTKDQMMGTFISPARSDPKEDGLVQSVSERGKKQMLGLVSWQPSGSVIAGVDCQLKAGQKQHRVIFWEKNGLRHLEFNLPTDVS